ncbi:MAG: bifunctional DNA primase/polymerase [Dehalococcoidia bacterium]|nr:bifunctional DNA primase/polymerase [Dehalococcoidia bacterium]
MITTTSSITPLAHALRYAGLGWAVFPVASGSKKPLAGSAGVSEATTDADQIRNWWAATPGANIGIACGKSGLLAIDLDVRTGGLVSMAALDERHGPLPPTVEAITPTNGRHLIFKQPAFWGGESRRRMAGHRRSRRQRICRGATVDSPQRKAV